MDEQDKQAYVKHLFSSPLTALRGALDLLRHPKRRAEESITRELFDTMERSSERLRHAIDLLLAHSRIHDDIVEISVPLSVLLSAPQPRNSAPSPDPRVTPTLAVPDQHVATTSVPGSVLMIGPGLLDQPAMDVALQEAGYHVMSAGNGAQGIDMARATPPSLIVLDLDLLQPGALQIAQVLREDPETKTIPMIYVAGQSRPPAQLPPHVELMFRSAAPAAMLELVDQTIAGALARAEQVPALLIVDDDTDIQRILMLRFQRDGYRVVVASTGAAALIAAQKQTFNMIILDLLLPDIDGFSVLGALRARSSTAMTPIILLSARDSAAEKVRGLQLGADDYVTKPFSPAELQARVLAALRRHEREAGANPSTRLPGNIAIEQALRTRIQRNLPFAVCYADIDNFKAYNDTYSFLKGDAVIHQTAHVLLDAIEQRGNQDDFVGHIGGDDFVAITTPDRATLVSQHALASFDLLAPLFYDPVTRERGYIDALDRQGRATQFPFVSLSIGIVSTALHPIQHVAEVAQRSVEPKKRAKELPGSVYVFED